LTKPNKTQKQKKGYANSPGSGAAAVKVAGHFFDWVGLRVGKKMNAPEGLDLDSRCVRRLVGNCLFLYILFFVYKIFIPCAAGSTGSTVRRGL